MKKIFTLIVMVMFGAMVANAQLVGSASYCEGITTVRLVDHMGNTIGFRKLKGNWQGMPTGVPLAAAMARLDYENRREAALRTAYETGGYVGYGYGGYYGSYYGDYYPIIRIGGHKKAKTAKARDNGDDMYRGSYRGARTDSSRTSATRTNTNTNTGSRTRSAASVY